MASSNSPKKQTAKKAAKKSIVKNKSVATKKAKKQPSKKAQPVNNTYTEWTAQRMADLLDVMYDSAMEHSRWESSLQTIAEAFGANNVSLITRYGPMEGMGVVVSREGKSYTASPTSPFHLASPFQGLVLDQLVSVQDFLSEAQWKESEYYKQWCAPYDVYYILAVDFEVQGRGVFSLRMTRPKSAGTFSQEEKKICSSLVKHLKRAIGVYQGMRKDQEIGSLYRQAVSQMMVGLIVLDADGKVLETNQSADLILASNDGLEVRHGKLHARWKDEDIVLQETLSKAVEDPEKLAVADAIAITRPSGKPAWGLLVKPIEHLSWMGSKGIPALALFVRDPDGTLEAPSYLAQQLFHLTPSEAVLSIQLCNGLSLEEAAKALGIKHNTARAHLRAIFSKTGARRQTELVRMLLNSVMMLGSDKKRDKI